MVATLYVYTALFLQSQATSWDLRSMWSSMSTLPKVTTRPMFGLRGFYRGKKIFAALPVTRGIRNPNALIFRIQPMPADLLERAQKEPRIDTENRIPSAKWFTFELHSESDFRDALWWLNQAYEHAK